MATHCSVLAWRIPGTGEPGGLPSMGSHRVGHDWSDIAAAAAKKIKYLFYRQEPPMSFVWTTHSPSHQGWSTCSLWACLVSVWLLHLLSALFPQSSPSVVPHSHNPITVILGLFIALLRLPCSDDQFLEGHLALLLWLLTISQLVSVLHSLRWWAATAYFRLEIFCLSVNFLESSSSFPSECLYRIGQSHFVLLSQHQSQNIITSIKEALQNNECPPNS